MKMNTILLTASFLFHCYLKKMYAIQHILRRIHDEDKGSKTGFQIPLVGDALLKDGNCMTGITGGGGGGGGIRRQEQFYYLL